MKYIIILGDGMADLPVPELNGKTPLECAKKPTIDFLAQNGEVGLVKTIPEGMPNGSDTANLSVMGYDVCKYYTGRSPIEAISMGISLEPTDVTFRCNLVTLTDEENYPNKIMFDYSSDEISTQESHELIKYLASHLDTKEMKFYPGISYRHCVVHKNTHTNYSLTPPHDILDKQIEQYLPKGDGADFLTALMVKSYELLKDHPINISRKERGLNPANSIWLWGQGTRPLLPEFKGKYNLEGAMISAVDLLKGIGICGGLKIVNVEGATGNIHTNFLGKAQAAIDVLNNGCDFVYVHVEAPDECGHRHEVDNKVLSIEYLDEKVVKPIFEAMSGNHDFSIMVVPDHPTPLTLRTHTSDPVPFLIYRSTKAVKSGVDSYTEANGKSTGVYVNDGYKLIDRLILE